LLIAARARGGAAAAELDALHALARRHHLVSPYSSMLVLVDDAQREALRRAEKEPDRFERSVESGVKRLPGPVFGGLRGTAEPGETALLATAVAALALAAHR